MWIASESPCSSLRSAQAPEMITQGRVSAETDIYSLSITIAIFLSTFAMFRKTDDLHMVREAGFGGRGGAMRACCLPLRLRRSCCRTTLPPSSRCSPGCWRRASTCSRSSARRSAPSRRRSCSSWSTRAGPYYASSVAPALQRDPHARDLALYDAPADGVRSVRPVAVVLEPVLSV